MLRECIERVCQEGVLRQEDVLRGCIERMCHHFVAILSNHL